MDQLDGRPRSLRPLGCGYRGGHNEGEFSTAALGVWDGDDDHRLSEAEWSENARGWYGTREYGAFGDWDTNRDSFLDGDELGAGFQRTGLFGEWDRNRNNLLEENEWREGSFGIWDANDDNYLDTNEWSAGMSDWGIL